MVATGALLAVAGDFRTELGVEEAAAVLEVVADPEAPAGGALGNVAGSDSHHRTLGSCLVTPPE